jgi:hypothetical protein
VVVTRNNFLIALAPYFFPLYAMLVVGIYATGRWLGNWHSGEMWFHLLLGAAYAFHITLTWHILKANQTDITEQGYIFSIVIIFLGNMSILLFGMALLGGKVSAGTALKWWGDCTIAVVRWLIYWR